jgi:hypothetical protein
MLPVQLSNETIANVIVVALTTILLGNPEEMFCMKKSARGG